MASNNCRQIIMCLKIWANDNNGVFPDASMPLPKSSNQAFRRLFQDEITQEERIFGASYSPFKPDNYIGVAPSFSRALEPGENLWAMVAGLKADINGTFPLIFESPLNVEWPLQWRVDRQKDPVRGWTWARGKLVIGRSDMSVNVVTLVKKDGVMVLPDSLQKLFGGQSELPLRILNIEEKK